MVSFDITFVTFAVYDKPSHNTMHAGVGPLSVWPPEEGVSPTLENVWAGVSVTSIQGEGMRRRLLPKAWGSLWGFGGHAFF